MLLTWASFAAIWSNCKNSHSSSSDPHPIVSDVLCQGPSHGGSYMDKGTLYIRIGLPPFCLMFFGLLIVHMRMIWWSKWYRVVLVRCICLWAPGGCFYCLFCLLTWYLVSHDELLCLWLVESVEACICWCSAGFLMILLLIVTVLGSWYFSYWYNNIGQCGL